MTGYLDEIQRGIGQALKEVHHTGGFKVRYTLVTNRTTDPLTTVNLDIWVQPMPQVRNRERIGGRWQEALSAAALPVYIVSRESLKVSGIYYEPTTDDTFRELNSSGNPTGPTFHIEQITTIGGRAAGWMLTVVTQFHDKAGG